MPGPSHARGVFLQVALASILRSTPCVVSSDLTMPLSSLKFQKNPLSLLPVRVVPSSSVIFVSLFFFSSKKKKKRTQSNKRGEGGEKVVVKR
ncbi:hypothetical protein ECG_03598 [Echinococcus granulosus]|uniref:Secreted protein n=1 Tax=Echinococcus granulosus TaxID=6210 RepID=A0A068X0K9_ECHGR|nr:hypothetical protein ECG_03598 [Echinococcus granulosus]CDS23444.1 hypothetical protein EgrG_000712900 [Echinococcus granulosus]